MRDTGDVEMPEGGKKEPRLRSVLVDAALVLGLWYAVLSLYLLSGLYFPCDFGDMLLFSRPAFKFTADCLLRGELPLWDPYSNYPMYALGGTGPLYPTTVIYGLMQFRDAFRLDAFLHIYLSGFFCTILGRWLYRGRPARLALAVLYMSAPFMLLPTWGGNMWQIRVLAWMPLAAAMLVGIVLTGRSVWALGLALVWALQVLAGDPQMFMFQGMWFACGFVIALGYRLRKRQDTVKSAGWKATLALGAAALAGGISAAQLLAARELMALSVRSNGITLEYVSIMGTVPLTGYLWTCLEFYLLEPVWDTPNVAFAGPITAGLILTGLIGRPGCRRITLAGLVVFGIAYTIWPESGIGHLVLRIPVIGQARMPMRMFNYAMFASYLLACLAVDRLSGSKPAARRWAWGLMAGVTLLYSWRVLHCGYNPAWAVVPAVLAAAGSGMLALRLKSGLAWAMVPLVAAVAFENVVNVYAVHRAHDASTYALSDDYSRFSAERTDNGRVAVFTQKDSETQPITAQGLLMEDRMIGANHTVLLGDYTRWLTDFAGTDIARRTPDGLHAADTVWNLFAEDWVTEESLAALDLLNIRYLISIGVPLALPEADVAAGGSRFRKYTVGSLTVYENLLAMPEVFTVHDVEACADFDAALTQLRSSGFDYRNRAVVTGDADEVHVKASAKPDRAEVTGYEANRVTIEADMEAPGLLVLTDVNYPGWAVTVDGQDGEVVTADGILRGVFLSEGAHTVCFEFRPSIVTRGFAVSLVAMLAAVVWAGAIWRKRAVRTA